MSDLRRAIREVLRPIRDRVMLMVGRCVIEAATDENLAVELQLSALSGETLSKVEQLLAYGFTSQPMPPDENGKAEGILAAVGGNRLHSVVIATEDRRFRPSGECGPGESIQYDHQGSRIHLKAGEEVLIRASDGGAGTLVTIESGQVVIDAPTVTINGDLVVNGDVSDSAGSMAAIRTGYNSHTHAENDAAPAPTQPPTPTI